MLGYVFDVIGNIFPPVKGGFQKAMHISFLSSLNFFASLLIEMGRNGVPLLRS